MLKVLKVGTLYKVNNTGLDQSLYLYKENNDNILENIKLLMPGDIILILEKPVLKIVTDLYFGGRRTDSFYKVYFNQKIFYLLDRQAYFCPGLNTNYDSLERIS